MTSKWDKRFLSLAREVSSWSKDPSSKVGAVAVSNHGQVLGTGYNGFPRGIADTDERYANREEKYRLVVHAEMNCILNAAYLGSSLKDSTMYVYGLPVCGECSKGIIQAGIKSIVMPKPDEAALKWLDVWTNVSSKILMEAGVDWLFIDP